MPGDSEIRQKATVGRDANIAGRDLIVNVDGTGSPVAAVPGLLPRDVPDFTGRDDELTRLMSLTAGGRVVVTAIGGIAGVGKTALAVHAAHQMLAQFRDGHLYADLHGYTEGQDPAEPGQVLKVFLRHLGVPADELPTETEERSGLLRQLLATRQVLMVLDNAQTEAQVRPLLPGAGESLVLVTSRSVLPGLEVNERISLDVLPPDEAAAMLTGLIGEERAEAESEAVAVVAGLCGRLPLALRIAGQLLATHPVWPVKRLVNMLADEQTRLARLGAGDLRVRAVFEVSYAQLAEEDARLFRLLGLHPCPEFDSLAAAALAGAEPEAAACMLDRLVEASLITEDAMGLFGMHDLLRLFARATCQQVESQAEQEAAESRVVGYYVELAGFLDSYVDPELRPAVAQEAEQGIPLPSIRNVLATFQARLPSLLAALRLAAERGLDQEVWKLSESMADSLSILRYFDVLLTIRGAAVAAAHHAGDTAAEGKALNGLGNAYSQLGRLEDAITPYQQALTICRETGYRRGEGAVLGNLGSVYSRSRRFEEAITQYQDSLAICRETGDWRSEATALNGLASTYQDVERLEDAIVHFQQALTIYRKTGDQRGKGVVLCNLGVAYGNLRGFEDAIDCYDKALAIFREIGDRYNEGQALNHLGNAYHAKQWLKEAVDCFREALAIFMETGDRHSQGMALNNLGTVCRTMQRFKEAIDCYQLNIAICRETGDRHDEGQSLCNLGNTYHAMRQPDRAAECWREAAAALRDSGDHEYARQLEERAASVLLRRRWRGMRRRPSS